MTREEFSKMRFGANMTATYKGRNYDIVTVNFEEDLIGLELEPDEDPFWVRCENVELK